MNDKIIWDYIKKKSLGELNKYALDVPSLFRDIRENIITPNKIVIDEKKLASQLKNIVPLAGYLEKKLGDFNIDKVNGEELEVLLPVLNITERSFVFHSSASQMIFDELKKHEDFKTFGLSAKAFIVNRDTAKVLFKVLMESRIDTDAKKLKAVHQLFNDMRKELSEADHQTFFGCPPSSDGPFKLVNDHHLDRLLDEMFKPSNSPNSILSQRQLWQLSKKLTPQEHKSLFGVEKIKRTDNIDLSDFNWSEAARLASQYELRFRLERYQYQRFVKHLSLEQAMDLVDMTLNKASGFGENSLQGGSQWLAAYGLNVGPITKILSTFMGGLVNCSVAVQRAIYMPILAALGLITAKRNYDAEVDFEEKQRKKVVLDCLRTTQQQRRNQTEQERLNATRAQYPDEQGAYQSNEHTCYYLILKSWLDKEGLLVKNLLEIEEKFLAEGKERELLFYLTHALITSPKAIGVRPKLQKFVDAVQERIPNFAILNDRTCAKSPFNEDQADNDAPKHKLRWEKFKDWYNVQMRKINPYISPTVSAITAAFLIFFIAWMLTAVTPYLIAAGVGAGIVGGLVWFLRYKSDRKKEKIEKITAKNHTIYHQTLNENEKVHQHEQLCKIINEIEAVDDVQFAPKSSDKLAETLVDQEETIKTQQRQIDELKARIRDYETMNLSSHPSAFFTPSDDEIDEQDAIAMKELSPNDDTSERAPLINN